MNLSKSNIQNHSIVKMPLATITKRIGIFFFIISIFFAQNIFAQSTKYSGYYCTGVDQYSSIKYSRQYKENGDVFVTLYKISSSRNGYYLNITVTHDKSEKEIVVSIDDITVKVGGHINTEVISYETPSTKMFGRRGSFQSQFDAQGKLPNDLALKFVSRKFENLKLVHITKGINYSNGRSSWYILDENR